MRCVGSALIGQSFTQRPIFLAAPLGGRRSGYDAAASSGSNLGPTSTEAARAHRGRCSTPARRRMDVASLPRRCRDQPRRSGLDPDISPAYALLQVGARRQGAQSRRRTRSARWSKRTSKARRSASSASRASMCSASSIMALDAIWRPASRSTGWTDGPISQSGDSMRPSIPKPCSSSPSAERRGKLKVFLGAAPGRRQDLRHAVAARGGSKPRARDVVVGLVETHGRAETAALLEGLEVLPRQPVAYSRPHADGVRSRRRAGAPARAHHRRRARPHQRARTAAIPSATRMSRNCSMPASMSGRRSISSISKACPMWSPASPASPSARWCPTRSSKRPTMSWWSTSRRTSSSSGSRTARSICPRMRAAPPTISSSPAISRPCANWRCAAPPTASTTQMVDYLRQNAIEGPWPTAERILVCVGPDRHSQAVVRAAGRLASGLNAGWVAAHLDQIGREPRDADRPDGSMRRSSLRARLGADASRLSARDLPAEVLRYARRENITQIVLGRSRASLAQAAARPVAVGRDHSAGRGHRHPYRDAGQGTRRRSSTGRAR